MDTLRGITAFVRSVDCGGFSAAARQLGLTPAAVSKAVASLEQELGIRLLQRTTRSLSLSEAGQQFYTQVRPALQTLDSAINNAVPRQAEVQGLLRLSLAPAFGREYILPLMGEFLHSHPRLQLDWHFDNRAVDLVAEGFDACIGGGFALDGSLVARELAPLHLVLVATPAYLQQYGTPQHLDDLPAHHCVQWRSPLTGRVRDWQLSAHDEVRSINPRARITVSDPDALCRAVLADLGIGLVGLPHVLPLLQAGRLQRVLAPWYQDSGTISLYYPAHKGQAPKLRHFVDWLLQALRDQQLATRLQAKNL